MKKHHIVLFGGALATVMLVSCGDKGGGKTPKKDNPTTQNPTEAPAKPYVAPPAFNADSAHAFVAKQVSFGPRVPNTAAQKKCADWLEKKLRSYTTDVIVQSGTVKAYTGEDLQMYNIIARFNPKSTNRVMLCSHWDTRPFSDHDSKNKTARFDGADDGGSGTAVLLEIARLLAQTPSDAGIDIVLFDTEDYGDATGVNNDSYCLGSQYWAKNPPIPGYFAKYAILLDMVGAKNAKFAKEGFSVQNAPSIVEKIWAAANRLGYGKYFTDEITYPITDDHVYVQRSGIPAVDIVNYGKHNPDPGFGAHWHTQNDNLANIDKDVLKAVGQTVMDVIYNE